mgnify:CR=1 FL=1
MKNSTKVIFHIDLNAFYASCQLIEDPYLKGKPFIVGGSGITKRGVVLTASYEARKYGIHSGMNVRDAMNLYPKLRVVPTKFSLYKKHSDKFFNYLKQFSDKIMKASIDEAYLDMTHHPDPLKVAKDLQDKLFKTYQLPSSIGIAPTLFLAKMASDIKKPLGITVMRKKDIVSKLFPLPIKELYGLGKKTYPIFMTMGIDTIGAFTKPEHKQSILTVMSEDHYQSFLNHVLGKSSDYISTQVDIPKSISQETTMNYGMNAPEAIKEFMVPLIEHMVHRLQKHRLKTKTMGFKYKTERFQVRTKTTTIIEPTDQKEVIQDTILSLFDEHYDLTPIRLIGVYVQTHEDYTPFNLFTYHLFNDEDMT